MYATSSTGGTSPHKVVKCRKCGEILSRENYVKSREEIEKEEKEKADGVYGYYVFIGILSFFGLVVLIGLVRAMAP